MRRVPSIDASGMHALEEFHDKCKRDGTLLLLSGVHAQPLFAFTRSGFIDVVGSENMFGNLDDALNRAGIPRPGAESAPADRRARSRPRTALLAPKQIGVIPSPSPGVATPGLFHARLPASTLAHLPSFHNRKSHRDRHSFFKR